MIPIEKNNYPKALALFKNSPHQLKLAALAEGLIEGTVWADAQEPAVCAVQHRNKLLIASKLSAEALAPLLRPFLLEEFYDKKLGCGAEDAAVCWDGEHVREALEMALEDKCPAYAVREYDELEDPAVCKKAAPPEGYDLRPADAALLGAGLLRTEELKDGMRSVRASVEAFLGQGFGICAVSGNEIAGWCLSEYDCSLGCEVGIGVGEWHRRHGLVPAMASAFAEEAARRGLPRIGWHRFRSSAASAAAARSAGFQKTLEYGCMLLCAEPAAQYALNGNLLDGAGDFERAAEWYARALAERDAPPWVHVRLAMALTGLGRLEEALGALNEAVRRGFHNWGWLRSEPRLEPLRGEDDWKQLF